MFFKRINIKLLMGIFGVFLAFVFGVMCYISVAIDNVVINEVCGNNFSVLQDESGEYPDYIELYNPSKISIPLEGYCLSDSSDMLDKYTIETGTIPANGYYIIYADEKSREDHASFRIGKNGESVYLSNKWGKLLDQVNVPKIDYNTCYARNTDGDDNWSIREATPGVSNNNSRKIVEKSEKEVEFSREGGFYEEEFYLELKTKEDDLIYYTLDGSEPTKESVLYEQPILIQDATLNENNLTAREDLAPRGASVPDYKVDKATVVRAVVYDEENDCYGKSEAKTYFVNYNNKTEYDNLPIISLVTDAKNLFDYEYGIYGNGKVYQEYLDNGGMKDGEILESFVNEDGKTEYLYMASNAFNEGKEWEREAQIEYFDSNHTRQYAQNIGIRISGQSTRSREQKSFKLYARDIYDDSVSLKMDWNGEEREWESVKIRNGGSEGKGSKIKEPFLHSLAQGRFISTQDAAPHILFINGEYWGIYSLRERYTEEYFRKYYGVEANDLWVIDSAEAKVGDEKALEEYHNLLFYMENTDFTITENYKILCDRIDIQSLIDYYCINLYINNTDTVFLRNIALWRSISEGDEIYKDGKWRWMLYDVDISVKDCEQNSFDEANNGLMAEPTIKNLMKNEEFRQQFRSSFLEIANSNFRYEIVEQELQTWIERYKEQVLKTQKQFVSLDYTEETFDGYIESIRSFFEKRADYIIPYMEEYLDVQEKME